VKRQTKPGRAPQPDARFTMTENQRQILLRLFAGSNEEEIAADTNRKPSTIFNTVRRVRERLGARGEYDLMRECLLRGIVTIEEISARAETRRAACHRRP
jgi:DNA-binding NarL/FixJ family response regulator